MRLAASVLFSTALLAQGPSPVGMVRGNLLEIDNSQPSGEFSIRSIADNRVFRFFFDPRTFFEREKQRISAAKLTKGDTIEVLADRGAGLSLGYARMVNVIDQEPQRQLAASARLRAYRSAVEHIVPRGTLTFSGVVVRVNDERVVLHTRSEGQKTILLRQDTRYLEAGTQVEAASLKPNTRVFVRAGKNLDNEVEAYSVVWGEILTPGSVQ